MTERKSPLRLGPKPEAAPRETKPRAKRKSRARSVAKAVIPMPEGPLPGFDAIDSTDYTQQVPGREGRFLTVSPLRAIMDEEAAREGEHVVTERTRQGVLYGAGLGVERPVIAAIMGIDVETLERCYPKELRVGTHLMMNDIQTNLYNIARDPQHTSSVKAGMYLLGKLGNQAYKDARASLPDVDPRTRTIDVSLLDEDQRAALRSIVESALQLASPGTRMIEGSYTEIEADEEDEESVL